MPPLPSPPSHPRTPLTPFLLLLLPRPRAACDPGAVDVFKSVFYLPPPRPLNYLIR